MCKAVCTFFLASNGGCLIPNLARNSKDENTPSLLNYFPLSTYALLNRTNMLDVNIKTVTSSRCISSKVHRTLFFTVLSNVFSKELIPKSGLKAIN